MKYDFNEVSNILGEPTLFGGLLVPQPKVKDIDKFYYGLECLKIRKNRSTDIKVIKMTYLEFLLTELKKEEFLKDSEKIKTSMLYYLVQSIFGEFNVFYELKGSSSYIEINGNVIKAIDFDDFKDLIFKQNNIQFDENLTEEIESAIKKVEKYKNKNEENKVPTFAETIVSYHVATMMPYESIKNLTISQLQMGLERFNLLKDFEVYTYAYIQSGKDDITHWMSHINRDVDYSKYFTNSDNTIKKL